VLGLYSQKESSRAPPIDSPESAVKVAIASKARVLMPLLSREVLGFLASFLLGTVFLDVFLTMYERHRLDVTRKERRVFQWSVKGEIGIGILVVLLQFLLSN
jgi:hypothetical protein